MNNEKNIFEVATREKYRFPFKGLISVEDLWDLSIRDLDSIFKTLNSELKKVTEESLLGTKTQQNKELDTKIQVIKYVFEVKSTEEQARLIAKEKSEQRQKILAAISAKQDDDLKNGSVEELQQKLRALDD